MEGFPREYRSESHVSPMLFAPFQDNKRNADCRAQLGFRWSTFDRQRWGSRWFMIRETQHSDVHVNYVFEGTDGWETQFVMGVMEKAE